MAYGLKYKAEWKNTKGQYYRLQIYQRDFSGGSTTIGDLCGCVLEVQGNMGSIITPIIKTQLRFMVVDAPDEPTAGTGKKFGNWQEFFTPDATLYKVELYELNGITATQIWTGYITPDSWQEDLGYRGAITVTARDNVGHLKDFPFVADGSITPDENGLIELRWLFERAMEVIDFPMDFGVESWGSGQYSADVPCTEDDDYLTEALVNAALYEGMNWYEVLEQTLEAIGYTFRYVGRNKCVVACLRNLSKLGNYTAATGSQTMEFYGGVLELDPAVKKIEEEQDYKQANEVELEAREGLEFGATTTYRCKTDGNSLPGGGTVSIPEHDADKNDVTAAGATGWDVGSAMLNPALYQPDDFLRRAEGDDGWRNYAFVAANQQPTGGTITDTATYRFKTRTAAMKVTFRFTPNAATIEYQGSAAGKMSVNNYALASVKYYVMFTDGTTTLYWDGGKWQSSPLLLEKTYDAQNQYETEFTVETGECADIASGTFVVRLGQVIYKMWYDGGHGAYARVAAILAEINAQTALKSNKVTTINNNDYNVLLTRRPLFGALSREMGFVRPANYLAGLFYYPYVGADPVLYPYQARFTDGGSTVPLPVLIHQQILCYYFGAARVLSGSCAPVSKARFAFDKLCVYKGVTYLLQGGTLDLFSGIVTGAVLREFTTFTSLWSGGAPSYSEDVIYNS